MHLFTRLYYTSTSNTGLKSQLQHCVHQLKHQKAWKSCHCRFGDRVPKFIWLWVPTVPKIKDPHIYMTMGPKYLRAGDPRTRDPMTQSLEGCTALNACDKIESVYKQLVSMFLIRLCYSKYTTLLYTYKMLFTLAHKWEIST